MYRLKIRSIASAIAVLGCCAFAQAQYEELDGLVNPFTGNVNYQQPLINIDGPHGESFSVHTSYNSGGIRMNQPAGLVGLGWGISAPQITRIVEGVPDDWNGNSKTIFTVEEGTETKNYYGPIYFRDFPNKSSFSHYNTDDEMDTYSSEYRQDGNTFVGVSYDKYMVNAPGLSGEMMLKLFEYASLVNSKNESTLYPGSKSAQTTVYYDIQAKKFTERPRFYMKNLKGVSVDNYLKDLPKDDWEPENYDENHSGTVKGYNGDVSPSGFIDNGYYIVYWTNGELNTLKGNGDYLAHNFIESDYYYGVTRENDDLIGAIQVTDPSGMTYHFSLPEYVYSSSSITFETDDDGLAQSLSSSSITLDSNIPSYAKSWKLVAITGPDFKDQGVIGKVDAADEGYWVHLDYGKVQDKKEVQSPMYELTPDINMPGSRIDITRYELPKYRREPFRYEKTGSVNKTVFQDYYINKVSTATHNLLFYYSSRNDNIGSLANGKGVSDLKLDRILLINSSDLSTVENLRSAISFSSDFRFPFGNVDNLYSNNAASGYSNYLLGEVAFEYDYSLCANYYSNINTNISTNTISIGSDSYEGIVSKNSATNSGKLTLKKIRKYYQKRSEPFDPTIFEYSSNNPDFNPIKIDKWGFYKSNQISFFGNYTDGISKDYVDAWLLSKIYKPNGSEIELEYESDDYIRVGNSTHNNDYDYIKPMRTFKVESIVHQNTSSTTNSQPRTIRLKLKLEGDLPTSFLGTNTSREALAMLRFKGSCKTEFFAVGTSSNIAYDRLIDDIKAVYLPADPALGMGFKGNIPAGGTVGVTHAIDGKIHQNVLQGDQFYSLPGNTNTYGRNLVSLTVNSINEVTVELKEPKFFNDLYRSQTYHEQLDGNGDKIYCNDCGSNDGADPYDYSKASNFMFGYISVGFPAAAYGGGVRLAKATLKNLDNNETFHIKMNYSVGTASTEPDRYAPISYDKNEIPSKPGHGYRFPYTELTLPIALYRSKVGNDPLIPAPMVYYTHPKVEYFGNDNWLKTHSYAFHGGQEFPKIKYSLTDIEGDFIAKVDGVRDRIEVDIYNKSKIIDQSSLFGKPISMTVSAPDGDVSKSYGYSDLGSIHEYFTKRTSNDVRNNGNGEGGVNPKDIYVNHFYGVHEVKNYVLTTSQLKKDDGTRVTQTFSNYDPVASAFLSSKEQHNVLGVVNHETVIPGYKTNPAFESKYQSPSNKNITGVMEKFTDNMRNRASQVIFSDQIPSLNLLAGTAQPQVSGYVYDYPIVEKSRLNPNTANNNWTDGDKTTLINEGKLSLESYNLNTNIASSVHYESLENQIVSQAENASYFSNFFEAFEYTYYDGDANKTVLPSHAELSPNGAVVESSGVSGYDSHTGDFHLNLENNAYLSYKVAGSTKAGTGYIRDLLMNGKTYVVRYWVQEEFFDEIDVTIYFNGSLANGGLYNQTLNFQPVEVLANNNGWLLFQQKFEVPDGFQLELNADYFELRISNRGSEDILIDDVSLKPVDASMMGFVYDKFNGQITHLLDDTNRYVRYEYDNTGRQIKIWRETATGEELLKETEYHHEKY